MRGGVVAVFVFGTRLLSISVHSCTHTQSHTHRGLQANMHVSTLTYTHSCILYTQTNGGDFMCTYKNTGTLAVMKPEENGTISYYFQCSNLERMWFFPTDAQ